MRMAPASLRIRLLPAALAGLSLVALAGLGARATKDNVGSQLPELRVQFTGEAPNWTGRPLLLEFWATSCSSCRESVSHLNSLYGKFKPHGLQTVGVTDDDEATVKAFAKDVPISYPVGHDRRGRLASSLGIVSIPHALLVDKSGRIVWEGNPLQITAGQLETLVK